MKYVDQEIPELLRHLVLKRWHITILKTHMFVYHFDLPVGRQVEVVMHNYFVY